MSMPAGVSELSNWRKSERSIANGECAEIASSTAGVFVRDTKDRERLTLCYTATSWRSFVGAVRTGTFPLS
jgi:Domain of unknown function (DUF397)